MTLTRRTLLSALASPAFATLFPGADPVRASTPVAVPYPDRLNFSPFLDAIAEISDDRFTELDSLLVDATGDQLRLTLALGRLTSRELVLAAIRRIGRYDGMLNAVITLNPDLLTIADRLDAERTRRETRSPLHGIPILLKDNIGTGGTMPTTAGALALADAYSDGDAFLVRRLRRAGLIVLGKANLSEWAGWMSNNAPLGFSAVGGQTANPYGEWLSPFGSSSGSAVSVAASYAPFSIGTETAGSIIAPAAVNSVVGIHPSLGLISRDRVVPLLSTMDTPGPLARTVTEAAMLLSALAQTRDTHDRMSREAQSSIGFDFRRALRTDGLRGKRLGLVLPYHLTVDLIEPALQALRDGGAEVVQIEPFGVDYGTYEEMLGIGLRIGVEQYLTATANPTLRTLADVVAFNERDPGRYAPFGQDRLYAALQSPLDPETFEAMALDYRSGARSVLTAAIEQAHLDLIVSVNNDLSLDYAAAGWPAITVPAGYDDSSGEPFGLTFVAPYLADQTAIAAAFAFEQISQFRRPPSLT